MGWGIRNRPRVETRLEHDVLRNGVAQAGDELVLGQQAFNTALFTLPEFIDQGSEIVEVIQH
jgi:hypothetical protein